MKESVADLIILCHIINNFEEFNNDFCELMKLNDRIPVVTRLWNIVDLKQNKDMFWDSNYNKKMKDFYRKHSFEIELINRYSSLMYFFNSHYDVKGNILKGQNCGNNFYFFYHYFLNNKDKLEQILELLKKIKMLGINTLKFKLDEDFNDQEYEAYTDFSANACFEYLENIEVISNYDKDKVRYRSLGSNYKITMEPDLRRNVSFNVITVNNLLFDADRLPDKLSEEIVFAEINKFLAEEGEKWNDVHTALDFSARLSINTDNLLDWFNEASDVIGDLKDIKNRNELILILLKIKGDLENLQCASLQFDDIICENNVLITKDRLEEAKEKKLR